MKKLHILGFAWAATAADFKVEVAQPGQRDYSPDKKHIHLVPHTHLDLGFLKPVDDYFTASFDKGDT